MLKITAKQIIRPLLKKHANTEQISPKDYWTVPGMADYPGDFNNQQQYLNYNDRIALLLSGGVDSAVALQRLYRAGYRNLVPFYLKIWLDDNDSFLGQCPWEEDLYYANQVAEQLGLKLRLQPLQDEYYQQIVAYTLAELRSGRTPSPDVLCNSLIKFGVFLQDCASDFNWVASGHYANLDHGQNALHRAIDPVKDQSYFLSRLSCDQLARLCFPLAGLDKTAVRQYADSYQLANATRRDSQGICFLGKLHYHDFVHHHLGVNPGKIIERKTGKILGNHDGYWFYTIGQRQGLGLTAGPWYVVDKQIDDNLIYVCHSDDWPQMEQQRFSRFRVEQPHLLAELQPGSYLSKIRHGPKLFDCVISKQPTAAWQVEFTDDFDRGIAAGQFAVFYQGSRCIASATIIGTSES